MRAPCTFGGMETPAPSLTPDFAARNAHFNALSGPQRRVAIAKDVISQLDAGKYITSSSCYFFTKGGTGDLQVVLEEHSCHVCAIGGLLASRARLGNNVTFPDGQVSREAVVKFLSRDFSKRMLDVLEGFYENGSGLARAEARKGLSLSQKSWWRFWEDPADRRDRDEKAIADTSIMAVWESVRCLTSDERMTWVMRNIIANNGSFVAGSLRVSE